MTNNNKVQKLKVYLDHVSNLLATSNLEGPKREFFLREVRKTKKAIEALAK